LHRPGSIGRKKERERERGGEKEIKIALSPRCK